MKHPKNIFLVGPMGAGKSAVGRHLARTLQLTFVDSDDEIESRTGVDVAFIFEKEGEDGFRKREAAAIDDLTRSDGVVLATGGGAVVKARNRSNLAGRGFVVYLYTSVDQQVARTRKGRIRPLLENDDPRGTLEELLQQRDPLYREIADLVVDTDGRKVHSVASEIIESIS
ncbi:MAG: shikimate kinase AroK [Gammaproteobacteria bacterium]|nr:shikimate kinase AroK [Gammaproteobacteria bacterium]MDH5619187.1 shikimate kinase AroK [Gammaproteobacteria bacterium]